MSSKTFTDKEIVLAYFKERLKQEVGSLNSSEKKASHGLMTITFDISKAMEAKIRSGDNKALKEAVGKVFDPNVYGNDQSLNSTVLNQYGTFSKHRFPSKKLARLFPDERPPLFAVTLFGDSLEDFKQNIEQNDPAGFAKTMEILHNPPAARRKPGTGIGEW